MTHARQYTLAVVLSLLACQTVAAQDLDKLIALNVQAKGGYGKLNAIKTARWLVDFELGKTRLTMNLEQKPPNKFRAEAYSSGQLVAKSVFDGMSGITMESPALQPRPMNDKELAEAVDDADMDQAPYINYKKKGYSVRYLGRSVRGIRELDHLEVKMPGVGTQHWFLDPKTYLEVEFEIDYGPMAGLALRLLDFKPVAGYLVPHRLEVLNPDREVVGYFQVNNVEANLPIPDERFTNAAK